jgi:WD40 repeat protein/ribosomal protein S27E
MSHDETRTPHHPEPLGDHAVRVRCPHCGNRIQLVEADQRKVVCQLCGSSFHVDPDATRSHDADKLPKQIGRFVVQSRLGRGAFGTVYRATDPDLDRTVAVKVPRAGFFATADEEARFLREAKAAAKLQHPGIVRVFEVADGDPPAIVSEFIDGVTLADRLTAGRPSIRESAELIAALADALDYAHRHGVVHRDVKPSNVLLDAAGQPHLADFGLARRDEAEITVTRDGQILGTPAYMSPEQAAGKAAVDGRADVYSLGVMLYELLAGELPFRGNTRMLLHQVLHDDPTPPRKRNDHIPRDLETVCLKALAKAPARRYATAGELAADLRRWLAGQPVLARPVSKLERGWRWAMRNQAVAGLLTMVLVVLAAGVAATSFYAVTWKRTADRLDDELKQSARREGELAVERGVTLCELGEENAGLLWLARGVENLERFGGSDDDRWYARMSFAAWGQHRHPYRMPFDGPTPTFAAFLPDGRSFLSVTENELGRYDAATGRRVVAYPSGLPADGPDQAKFGEVLRLLDGQSEVHLSRDGRAVTATGMRYRLTGMKADDREWVNCVWRWDATTGELLRRVEYTTQSDTWGWFHNAVWSPARDRLAVVRSREPVLIWDLDAARPPVKLPQEGGTALTPARAEFSPDNSLLGVVVQPNRVTVWDASTGAKVCDLTHPLPAEPKADEDAEKVLQQFAVQISGGLVAAFSPDSRQLFTAAFDGAVYRWDARTGRRVDRVFASEEPVQFLQFSEDARWLVASVGWVHQERRGVLPQRGPLRAWRWPDLEPWKHTDVDPDTVDPTGRTGVREWRRLIDLTTGQPSGRLLPSDQYVRGYTADGRVLVTSQGVLSGQPEEVRCWHPGSGRAIGPAVPVLTFHLDRERGRVAVVRDLNRPGGDRLPAGPSVVVAPPEKKAKRSPLEHWALAPADGTPERITLWAQVVTGMELDDAGVARPLDEATLADRRRWLDALGGSPLPKP